MTPLRRSASPERPLRQSRDLLLLAMAKPAFRFAGQWRAAPIRRALLLLQMLLPRRMVLVYAESVPDNRPRAANN